MTIGSGQRGFDIAQRRVDPLERGILHRFTPAAADRDSVAAPLIDDGCKASQSIGTNIGCWPELLLREGFDLLIGEAADLEQRYALWLALPVGLYGSDERRFAGRASTHLAARAFTTDVRIIDLLSMANSKLSPKCSTLDRLVLAGCLPYSALP